MNKQERLTQIKEYIEDYESKIAFHKSEIENLESYLSDLTLEESQLELELSKIEEDDMTEEEYKESLGNDAGKYDKVNNGINGYSNIPAGYDDSDEVEHKSKAWSHADDEVDNDR